MSGPSKNASRPATVEETAQDLKDGMKMVLDDSIDRVRGLTEKLEQDYYRPISRATYAFAAENPLVFTFFAIFGALSLVPIAFFLTFVTICISTLLGAVGIFLFMSISTLLFISTAILFPILFFTASLAIFATISLIGLFLLTRLFILTREKNFVPIDGLIAFWEETWARVDDSIPVSMPKVSVDVDIEIKSEDRYETEEKIEVKQEGDKLAIVKKTGLQAALVIKRELDDNLEKDDNTTSLRGIQSGTFTPTISRLPHEQFGSPEYTKELGSVRDDFAEKVPGESDGAVKSSLVGSDGIYPER